MRERLAIVVAGVMLGAIVIGGGGRVVMRMLARLIGRDPVFSLAGTLDILAYGALVGAAGGFIYVLLATVVRSEVARGLGTAILTYAGTIFTMPAHIADTARPFAGRVLLIHLSFGATFVAFGLLVALAAYGLRNRASGTR